MIEFRFSKNGLLSKLYFCSTFKISSLAFSFIASISFWQPSISSRAFWVSSSNSLSSTDSSSLASHSLHQSRFGSHLFPLELSGFPHQILSPLQIHLAWPSCSWLQPRDHQIRSQTFLQSNSSQNRTRCRSEKWRLL